MKKTALFVLTALCAVAAFARSPAAFRNGERGVAMPASKRRLMELAVARARSSSLRAPIGNVPSKKRASSPFAPQSRARRYLTAQPVKARRP